MAPLPRPGLRRLRAADQDVHPVSVLIANEASMGRAIELVTLVVSD